jgi:hypothetical protein
MTATWSAKLRGKNIQDDREHPAIALVKHLDWVKATNMRETP